jgi:hypothetical protein
MQFFVNFHEIVKIGSKEVFSIIRRAKSTTGSLLPIKPTAAPNTPVIDDDNIVLPSARPIGFLIRG